MVECRGLRTRFFASSASTFMVSQTMICGAKRPFNNRTATPAARIPTNNSRVDDAVIVGKSDGLGERPSDCNHLTMKLTYFKDQNGILIDFSDVFCFLVMHEIRSFKDSFSYHWTQIGSLKTDKNQLSGHGPIMGILWATSTT